MKNPEFNIDKVDHNMHARLQRVIDKGDIDITDFWQQGDGHQDVKLFCTKVEQVFFFIQYFMYMNSYVNYTIILY